MLHRHASWYSPDTWLVGLILRPSDEIPITLPEGRCQQKEKEAQVLACSCRRQLFSNRQRRDNGATSANRIRFLITRLSLLPMQIVRCALASVGRIGSCL